MDTKSSARHSPREAGRRRIRIARAGLLLASILSGTASAQQPAQPAQQTRPISGTVTSSDGGPLPRVLVRVEGTEINTVTNNAGRYTLGGPAEGFLSFTLLGYRAVRTPIGGRTTIDVQMERVSALDVVVVTAYAEEQRRGEVTGAVASVNLEGLQRLSSASILPRLDATVSGVTVDASGSPGARSTVRIRGISSFQNNDPLYVIDGTPVQDSYINWLNPNDIESIQVLKDASAASIYGSRASNGVVIIETTKRGAAGPPRATLKVRMGVATPVRGYDDFLIQNSLDYAEIVKRSYLNAGYPIDSIPRNIYGDPNNPTVPQYIWPNNCNPNPCSNVDLASYSFPNNLIMPGSPGTNWWDAVFGPAFVGDYNLDISGRGTDNAYGVSFNYLQQQGTAAYNYFNRGSVRVNTSFTRRMFTFGENIAVSAERTAGGVQDDNFGEGGFLGKNILSQPVVPVHDVGGNFASGKAVGLGNNTNPLKAAWAAKDNITRNDRIFGNVFASMDPSAKFQLRTKLGFNLSRSGFTGFNPITPENSEPNLSNSANENNTTFTDWTWSNTARLAQSFGSHNVTLLLGQEANRVTNRFLTASIANLICTELDCRFVQDALGDASTKNVSSTGYQSALLSFFGKVDYNFADRYVATLTLRQDGSSNLGPSHRWGTFPAVGLGWRVSQESFMQGNTLFSDLMVRLGWGITGNQLIPPGRIISQFGGTRGDTFYDIGGTNSNVTAGFRQASLGNDDLRWEENRSINAGVDVGLFNNAVNVVLDVYQRETNNLLFDPPIPATAGVADPPIVNVGKMQNRGVDVSVSHNSNNWGITVNGSHYRNKIVNIDGVQDFFYGPINTRFGNQVINKVGEPIGSFYGYIADGFFDDEAEIAAHADQDGASPGRIKFRDVNGDGQITLADRTIIGSPHPDFTGSLDMQFRRGAWDLSFSVFGSFGNEIFDVQKEFYVFRNFSTNVRKDLLTDSWTPENKDAKYPILDVNDNYSHAISSFYVEDGSYVRMRDLQLGFQIPRSWARWIQASRIYLQAENLFTITGYDGLDPALPAANITAAAGDIRDQYRGVDRGTYPSNRTFSIGFTTSF